MNNEFSGEGQEERKVISANELGEESISLVLILPRGESPKSVGSI
jgi:hypothetical protein